MIGQKIKKNRLENNLTQEEFGKLINVSTSMVGMYEIGVRKPSYEVLLKISDIFNVSTDYLLGRESQLSETDSKNSINESLYFVECLKNIMRKQKDPDSPIEVTILPDDILEKIKVLQSENTNLKVQVKRLKEVISILLKEG